jgi:hypothetical protein
MSDAELIERLPQEVEELRRANAELGCENAQLHRRLAQAMRQNEQWRRGHRKRSRRRCWRPEGWDGRARAVLVEGSAAIAVATARCPIPSTARSIIRFPRGVMVVGTVVCSDVYGAYARRGDLQHAYCGAHNIREAKKIAEVDPTPLALCFQLRLPKL